MPATVTNAVNKIMRNGNAIYPNMSDEYSAGEPNMIFFQ